LRYVPINPGLDSATRLVIVFESKGNGIVRVITGWDMGNAERRFYMTSKKSRTIKRRGDGIRESPAEYYSKHGILGEIEEAPV
jgi:hypothetical protein